MIDEKIRYDKFADETLLPVVNEAIALGREGKRDESLAKFTEAKKLYEDFDISELEIRLLGFNPVILASYDADTGVKQAEALKLKAEKEKEGIQFLSNQELDIILQNDKLREKYSPVGPFLTGTHIGLDGENGKFSYYGEEWAAKVPLKDGWYEQDEHGIPTGAKSDFENPKARKLWRVKAFSGLVARDLYLGRRNVLLNGFPLSRFGVLGKRIAPKQGAKE